jgi:hypothetical protein
VCEVHTIVAPVDFFDGLPQLYFPSLLSGEGAPKERLRDFSSLSQRVEYSGRSCPLIRRFAPPSPARGEGEDSGVDILVKTAYLMS